MNPAWSVIVFTALAGAAQGLVLALVLLVQAPPPLQRPAFLPAMLGTALALLLGGLAAAFLHLGRPARAGRAAAQWRTSWLSREVIVLPLLALLLLAWWLHARSALPGGAGAVGAGLPAWLASALPWAALAAALLLWGCTAMIYACLRFVREWAHWLTPAGLALAGAGSGGLLAAGAAAVHGEAAALALLGPLAAGWLLAAGLARGAAMWRNARLQPLSSVHSATGIRTAGLRQVSRGSSAGSFTTREFSHGARPGTLPRLRWLALGGGFALPALLAAWGCLHMAAWPWALALLLHVPGLLAERWLFFAEVRHPQNLYEPAGAGWPR